LWSIRTLIKHARENDSIINRESLERWQDDLLRRLNPRSFALAGVGVRRLLQWAADNGNCGQELARAVPTAKYERLRLPSTLTPNVLMRLEYHLMTQPVAAPPNLRELRDRALFFYVKATAARVSEILQVRRDNFERQVVRQKGGDSKALIAPPGVARFIREYLAARRDDLEWLWIAVNTDRTVTKLQDAGVLKIWERLAKKVGVRKFTTQELRHTAATLLVQRGHDLTDIMDLLGARDIRTVQGYKKIVADRLQRVRADLDVVY
jgi:site-specific recombinase XerD